MYQSNIIQTDVYNTYFLQFYDDGVMFMDSVLSEVSPLNILLTIKTIAT